ncbi:xanthine dehydrogenase family protein subunit M [Paenarthrobacter sp. Z7-10]|uniref:FAD binding domain-containing protein n=1 Tax=Paenarthrobacter sp. Z7-10 TaxID=2787635 RepID=UPI0022A9001E|nr:xanthine dehydrogenase family protein subunit M [Paenarthrobacter sp. Z7-10]MCZ2402178.1 xanthine dehydrogenase family protein subunit M [Paenarthrobacter sp. Z7-10]
MIPFDYRRAIDVDSAVAAATANPRAAYLGGGTNVVDHMKLGITGPGMLVDITGLPLDEIKELPDGRLRIGATVRNSDLAADPLIRRRYPVLSQALLAGASGQLRNLATTGGNLLQRTRCVYFQNVTTPCNKREPGSGCSALEGYTRYHAILGASADCVAVHPSDMAVAMAALDAVVVVTGVHGERSIPLRDFHRLPGREPERDTVLDHGELIIAVELPALPARARSSYRKVRDRASYAFALVSVAAVLELEIPENRGTVGAHPAQPPGPALIKDIRLALGGVAHKPWRASRAEEFLRGKEAVEENFRRAAEEELDSAATLRDNAFKVPMSRNTIVAVLRDLTAAQAGKEQQR